MNVVIGALFACAVLGGGLMLALRLRGGNPPLALGVVHGCFAAGGLAALLYVLGRDGFRGPRLVALIVLATAAGLGAGIAYAHRQGRLLSLGGVFIHALIALLGLATLATGLFGE